MTGTFLWSLSINVLQAAAEGLNDTFDWLGCSIRRGHQPDFFDARAARDIDSTRNVGEPHAVFTLRKCDFLWHAP